LNRIATEVREVAERSTAVLLSETVRQRSITEILPRSERKRVSKKTGSSGN
jgi:hypothetical protein